LWRCWLFRLCFQRAEFLALFRDGCIQRADSGFQIGLLRLACYQNRREKQAKNSPDDEPSREFHP
jgi:hypothetical protein